MAYVPFIRGFMISFYTVICHTNKHNMHMNHVFHNIKATKSSKQVVRILQLVFYRSFLLQRRAFCSHHEIPPPSPRRPQTSISVFPQELPPGTRGQSAASCQPRNVTSPQTHARTHTSLTRSPVVASPHLHTPQFALQLHQQPRRACT